MKEFVKRSGQSTRSANGVRQTSRPHRGLVRERPDSPNNALYDRNSNASILSLLRETIDSSPRQAKQRDRREALFGQYPSRSSALRTDLERALPDELKSKINSGDRARTWQETVIDVRGTGSALDSLAKSPLRTLGNAMKGLFSGFPSRAKIRSQPVVQNAINAAWTAGTGDYCERFGWITWDKNTNTYAVPQTSVGDQYACTPPTKPADPAPDAANQVYHVGEFHIHPPLDSRIPAMANPHDWPIGPSRTDEDAAQNDKSPGIVRDFDTVERTGGVTDYTYGPAKRTK